MDPLERLENLGQFRMVLGLSRMKRLMDSLDSPQMKVPSVHIAGTNGKGSTATMVDSILSEFGISTGLYTSPHLESITERMVFNGEQIDLNSLSSSLEHIFNITDEWYEDDRPTYFEALTAAFFSLSLERGSDMNIVEVGMGGRHDATNVIEPMAASIVSISLDHQDHLGEEEFMIAREKAGIITPSTPVILGPVHINAGERALRIILDICTSNGCPVVMITPPGHSKRLKELMITRSIPDGRVVVIKDAGSEASISVERLIENGLFSDRLDILDSVLPGNFPRPFKGVAQMFNMACALCISLLSLPGGFSHKELSSGKKGILNDLIECSTCPVIDRYGLDDIKVILKEGIGKARIRGRMEKIPFERADIFFDGAHNPDAAMNLSENLMTMYPGRKGAFLIAMMRDKEASSVLRYLDGIMSSIIVTQLDSPRAMSAKELVSVIPDLDDDCEVHVIPEFDAAVRKWMDLAIEKGLGVATGSFYLYSPLMDLIRMPIEPNP